MYSVETSIELPKKVYNVDEELKMAAEMSKPLDRLFYYIYIRYLRDNKQQVTHSPELWEEFCTKLDTDLKEVTAKNPLSKSLLSRDPLEVIPTGVAWDLSANVYESALNYFTVWVESLRRAASLEIIPEHVRTD